MLTTTRADELATAYLYAFEGTGEGPSHLVDELCEITTSPDAEEARQGTSALFGGIVEPLADRFEARLCELYREFFSRVVDYCRKLPEGRALHETLCGFGISEHQKLLERARKVPHTKTFDPSRADRLKKILVLSRVTLGADIAVTSVVLAKMKDLSQQARIVLLGGPKAASLFASDGRIDPVPAAYRRSGTLLERLGDWVSLVDTVDRELRGLAGDEYLIIDPDSRLTQLGLLPLTRDDRGYYFFESRSFHSNGVTALPQLTARWLEKVFGKSAQPIHPYVALADEDAELGLRLRNAVRGRLAAVNFGVGGKASKRVPDPFELELLRLLLKKGYRVILDRGAGDEELACMNRLQDSLRADGRTVAPIDPNRLTEADVMTWEGSLSTFGGLIRACDLYTGYDSAAGHLAAALGVSVITVFAGAPSDRMIERWRPRGRNRSELVKVGDGATAPEVLQRLGERLF